MITYVTHEGVVHELTQEGAQIAREGSHEARVWAVLPAKGQGSPMAIKELREKVGEDTAKVGQGRAFKNGWIGKEGDGLVKLVCGHYKRTIIIYSVLLTRNPPLMISLSVNYRK